jgi:hypothetical protein
MKPYVSAKISESFLCKSKVGKSASALNAPLICEFFEKNSTRPYEKKT